MADVAVLGEGERGDAGDTVGIDARYAARAAYRASTTRPSARIAGIHHSAFDIRLLGRR